MTSLETRLRVMQDIARWCKFKNDDDYNHKWIETGEGQFVCTSCGTLIELYWSINPVSGA